MTLSEVVSKNVGTIMREQNKNLKDLAYALGATEDETAEAMRGGRLTLNELPILSEWLQVDPRELLVRQT